MKIDFINGKVIYIIDPESLDELKERIDIAYAEKTLPDERYKNAYTVGYLGSSYNHLRECYNDLKLKVEHLENQLKTKTI